MSDFELQVALDRLAESLLPDEEVRQRKANSVAISHDGDVRSIALARSLPWYRADVTIAGEAEAGSGIRRVPFPQGGYLRHISIYARVAPSSQYTIRVTAGGVAQQFSLQAGMNTSMSGMNLRVNSGSWVYIDVLNAGDAEDVEITMLYSVVAGGSGGSGGSSGGGGGTATWGEIAGTLMHQADLAAALAGKAAVDHNHDGTYSPATHTHSWGDVTDKPTTFPPTAHGHSWGEISGKPAFGDLATKNMVSAPADIDATGSPTSTTYLRGDGQWVTPPNTNTTYSEITSAEITNGTASTLRTISGRRTQEIVDKAREGLVLASSLSLVATSGNYNDLSNRPSIPPQFNPIAGTNMTITGTYPNLTFNASGGGGGGGAVDSVNGQTGTVVLDADDIDATASRVWMAAAERTKLAGIEAGAQANVVPTWGSITDKPTEFPPSSHSHSWGQVTGKPSTFPPSTHSHDERYYTQAEVDAIVAAAQPEIHSQREQTNLTTPITSTNASNNYGQGTTARTTSLGALIPAISDGVWDVDVEAYATLYRDVSTGGMNIHIGDAVSSFGNALVRGIDCASGITLTAYACFKGITHTTTIDLRFSGFMTVGTTNCISHGWKITARRANS